MKILQINNYNYIKGGAEKVYQVSIELLKEKGHEVFFFSTADARNVQLCEGRTVEVNLWKDYRGIKGGIRAIRDFVYNRKVAEELDRYLRVNRPDVAHLHIFYGTLSNAIVGVLRKHNIPIIQSVHEFRLLCPSYTCLDSKFNICEACAGTTLKLSCIRKRCIKFSFSMSIAAVIECFVRDRYYSYQKEFAAFIMVSRFIQEKHIQYYPDIAQKCVQIYNSVDVPYYAKYSVLPSNKGNYYLYFGRLSYEKGIQTLIDVFAKQANLQLKIAGTGPMAEELKNRVIQAGVNNIEFLGFISGDELYDLIAKAKYTMVPSEWYENNPLSIIESLALGTPIIGSRIGGIPELIEEGKNGFLHEPKNVKSLNDALFKAEKTVAEEYESLCEYSLQIANDRFDNEIYYKKLKAVYDNVLILK